MTRGWFITLDGPGGAGKSTLAARSAELLSEHGIPTLATTQPSRGPIGQLARHHTHLFRGRPLACLVAADRYHHLEEEVQPALEAGTTVICDRYTPSSLVLQVLDGVEPAFVADLNAYAVLPDLAAILTCDTEELQRRLRERGSHGRFEDDPTLSAREAARYREVINELTATGTRVLELDSTRADAETLATRLVEAILALPSPPH